MPDLAPAKRRAVAPDRSLASSSRPLESSSNAVGKKSQQSDSAARYVELHCKTNFSFLRGASHPDELVGRAADLGYSALGITDRNSLAGIVRAHVAAKAAGLKLLIGSEITPRDGPPLLLIAPDRAAYGR